MGWGYFSPLKASQKLGIRCERFGLGRKPVYEIDPGQFTEQSGIWSRDAKNALGNTLQC